MSLRERQSIFARNFALLVIFAYENGYEITYGEGQRTASQQILYYLGLVVKLVNGIVSFVKAKKLTRTLKSQHLKKMAHDINLFRDGKLLKEKEDFKLLADYWRSLHPDNESGYDWDWDLGHFQMR